MVRNSMGTRSDVLALRDRFRQCLMDLSAVRNFRSDVVQVKDGPVTDILMEWVLYERLVLLGLVNEVRSSRGLQMVSLSEVAQADNLSAGHVDWLDKYSWRCAVLALGVE